MFHHVIPSSLFPTGAQVISRDAFTFRCHSKSLCGQEQRKRCYRLAAQGAISTPLLYLGRPIERPCFMIDSQSHTGEKLLETVMGQAGGGKPTHRRCELRVLGAQQKRRLPLRGTLGGTLEDQGGICDEA